MTSERTFTHHFSFLLPAAARRDSGIVVPRPELCFVEVSAIGMVKIMGPSREAVFDQVAAVLAIACEGQQSLSLAATMLHTTPGRFAKGRDWLLVGSQGGPVDSWGIAVNAPVAFHPGGMGHQFPRTASESAPAALSLARGDR